MLVFPELVPLPGGVFRMGNDAGRDDERPAHQVSVAPFRFARTQVTNQQYDTFALATGYPTLPFRHQEAFDRPDHPVAGVSWSDATAYCVWLSERIGANCRLPSEAEWEWAARSGRSEGIYPWGDKAPWEHYPDYATLWRAGPETVGRHPTGEFGLFELCENVHEWCSDWYDPQLYSRVTNSSNAPATAATQTRRASRGGAWRHHIKVSTCAARSSIPPEFRYADYGFRVAADA